MSGLWSSHASAGGPPTQERTRVGRAPQREAARAQAARPSRPWGRWPWPAAVYRRDGAPAHRRDERLAPAAARSGPDRRDGARRAWHRATVSGTASAPDVLWRRPPDSIRATRLAAFASWVERRRGLSFGGPPVYASPGR